MLSSKQVVPSTNYTRITDIFLEIYMIDCKKIHKISLFNIKKTNNVIYAYFLQFKAIFKSIQINI